MTFIFEKMIKNVSGTAGEALEVRTYHRLLDEYRDPVVVKGIIERELRSANETWESFDTYMRVKTKIQNDQISFIRAAKTAEAAGRGFLGDAGLAPR